MKLSQQVRSPLCTLGAALFDTGLRVREEYDELVLSQRDFELRIGTAERQSRRMLRCFISVAEGRLAAGYGEFSQMALEGHPVVAFGAGRGMATFEFAWVHPDNADWRFSGQRCQEMVDRVVGALVPKSVEIADARSFSHRG